MKMLPLPSHDRVHVGGLLLGPRPTLAIFLCCEIKPHLVCPVKIGSETIE